MSVRTRGLAMNFFARGSWMKRSAQAVRLGSSAEQME